MKSWKTGIWLFGVNLYISTFTFGGGYIVIPMIRKIFVQQKQLFTESELLEMGSNRPVFARRDRGESIGSGRPADFRLSRRFDQRRRRGAALVYHPGADFFLL